MISTSNLKWCGLKVCIWGIECLPQSLHMVHQMLCNSVDFYWKVPFCDNYVCLKPLVYFSSHDFFCVGGHHNITIIRGKKPSNFFSLRNIVLFCLHEELEDSVLQLHPAFTIKLHKEEVKAVVLRWIGLSWVLNIHMDCNNASLATCLHWFS